MAAWARVLIAVCVLICCVRAATAEGAEFGRTGWRGRVNLRPQDRVGFLRFKKVGSTTVSTYLMNRTAVCINSCAAQGSKTKCVQLSCLYTTNCSSCAELRSPAVANRQFCYPCYHLPIRKLSQQFDMHAHEWRTTHSMELADAPHLHLLVVVRDPYERLLSEFFFIRPACNQRKTELVTWLKQYTPQLQTAICNGDFETFATHPDSHATNGQVRQIVDYEFVTDRPLTAAHLELSLRLLAEASLVLVTDRLLPAGLALLDYTFSAETTTSCDESQHAGRCVLLRGCATLRGCLPRHDRTHELGHSTRSQLEMSDWCTDVCGFSRPIHVNGHFCEQQRRVVSGPKLSLAWAQGRRSATAT
eukprot:m.280558 g.280558  ORF g.280558 m.280558 type:complete len:360 (+) comp16170_c0_seq10:44-1123(+)